MREGVLERSPAQYLTGSDSPLRSFRPTYGKVQSANPGRWLTHQQAYGDLIGACADDTDTGLRDVLIFRLGLLGL
ncbi:MAG: hypothetical protein ACYDD7_15230, partial [Acidimicrobiales bacterium]